MELGVDAQSVADLTYWVAQEPKTAEKILRLVEEVRRNPLRGTGKPEPLKHLGAGAWSRRITQEHRLVYQVKTGIVVFLQARYHY